TAVGTPAKAVAQPEGATLNFAYVLDQNNRISQTTVTDGRGNPTVYQLTADGYTRSMNGPRGAQTTFDFNDTGLKTRETDPLGTTTLFEYDAKGNLRKQTTSGGDGATAVTETLYDQTFSKPISRRDANGNVTSFTLNGHGQTTQARMPNGTIMSFDYANNGDLVRATDERGLHTQIQYGAYGNPAHLERETQPGQSVITENSFDVRSRLLTTNDTLKPTVARTYDAMDRVKTETTTDPAGFRDMLSVVFGYTPLGQMVSCSMSGGGQNLNQQFEY